MLLGIIFFTLIGLTIAACPYEVKNLKYGVCKGKKSDYELSGISANLDDDCNLILNGCVVVNADLASVELKYKGIKNGIQLIQGKKTGCGIEVGKTKVKCPIAKKTKYCAKDWKHETPKDMLKLAIGKLKGVVNVVTDKGSTCYEGEAELLKK